MEAWPIPESPQRWRKLCLVLLLTICSLVFLLRGPFRAASASNLNDLISPYIQATAFVHGADPYSPHSLLQYWPEQALASRPEAQEFDDGSILVKHGIPTAYPLTTFLLLAPFTALSWKACKLLAIVVDVALFIAAIMSLIRISGLDGLSRLLFIALSLLFAPFHTGMATLNLAIAAVELGIISLWAQHTRRDLLAGLLTALSVGLKPQIGLCFLLHYCLRRRWRASAFALSLLSCIVVVSLTRPALVDVRWVPSFKSDNRALFTAGVLGDFTERNPLRFGLVNLQVGIYPLLHQRALANYLALSISAFLFLVWLALRYIRPDSNELLSLSALVTLSLLPIYHRFYDAALMIIPLCYVFTLWQHSRFAKSLMLTALLGVFLVPGGSLLETLRDEGRIPLFLNSQVWWNAFVMAHAVWCLLIVGIAFLYQMAQQSCSSTSDMPQLRGDIESEQILPA